MLICSRFSVSTTCGTFRKTLVLLKNGKFPVWVLWEKFMLDPKGDVAIKKACNMRGDRRTRLRTFKNECNYVQNVIFLPSGMFFSLILPKVVILAFE